MKRGVGGGGGVKINTDSGIPWGPLHVGLQLTITLAMSNLSAHDGSWER